MVLFASLPHCTMVQSLCLDFHPQALDPFSDDGILLSERSLPSYFLTTDVSPSIGWSAYCRAFRTGALWTPEDPTEQQINVLELCVVHKAGAFFLANLVACL